MDVGGGAMNLTELAAQIYSDMEPKGFNVLEDMFFFVPLNLALIHSEVSEALEAHRIGDLANLHEELADVIIRTLHLAHAIGVDIDVVVAKKMETNRGRDYTKSGKRY